MACSGSQKRPQSPLAKAQLVVAIAAGVGAWLVKPDLDSAAQHKEFIDFFATSATVIAALLVAIAIEARHVTREKFLANATALLVAVAELSAVAALSPALPTWMYDWLFTFAVAGGTGGLVAAVVIGAQNLSAQVDAARMDEVGKFLERARVDAEKKAAQAHK
jgi:hypothetical protein